MIPGTQIGQAPTSQARPRDTDHLWPLNLAARTRGSGEVLCTKSTFYLVYVGSEQKQHITTGGTAPGFLYDEGKSCFVFCFPIPQLSALLMQNGVRILCILVGWLVGWLVLRIGPITDPHFLMM